MIKVVTNPIYNYYSILEKEDKQIDNGDNKEIPKVNIVQASESPLLNDNHNLQKDQDNSNKEDSNKDELLSAEIQK